MLKGGRQLKIKSLAKSLLQCFRLSEDYDSDSDASDDENKQYQKGYKSIEKILKKSEAFVIDSNLISLN